MKFENFEQLIGRTPCVLFRPKEMCSARVWLKLEGFNPTGSVKDRAALWNIRGAIRRGLLDSGKTILDASSGNMACALAYFGATMGYPVTVVCSSKLTKDKGDFIKYFGAKLEMVGNFTIDGNKHCRDVIAAKEPEKYSFLDQLHNWDNPQAHYETTGPEILGDFPEVQAVFGSLGSGGTMNGVARYVREKRPATKIGVVESARGTKIPGVGSFVDGDYVTPFITQMRELNLADHCVQINLNNAEKRTVELAKQGFFCGIQTGAVVDALVGTVTHYGISGDVVAISGDTGWKNMDKLIAL